MFARRYRTGDIQKDCPKIRWKHFGRAATSTASRKSALRRMLKTFPLMPDPRYFKSSLAFDFGAKSGRAVRRHLRSGIFLTAFMCNARHRTDTDFSVTDRH